MNSRQNFKTLIWAIMGGEPSRGFRNEGQDDQYGNDADALKNDRDSPGIATGVAGEGIVNPVDKEDAKVQSRQLGANVCLLVSSLFSLDGRANVQTPRLDLGLNSA